MSSKSKKTGGSSKSALKTAGRSKNLSVSNAYTKPIKETFKDTVSAGVKKADSIVSQSPKTLIKKGVNVVKKGLKRTEKTMSLTVPAYALSKNTVKGTIRGGKNIVRAAKTAGKIGKGIVKTVKDTDLINVGRKNINAELASTGKKLGSGKGKSVSNKNTKASVKKVTPKKVTPKKTITKKKTIKPMTDQEVRDISERETKKGNTGFERGRDYVSPIKTEKMKTVPVTFTEEQKIAMKNLKTRKSGGSTKKMQKGGKVNAMDRLAGYKKGGSKKC